MPIARITYSAQQLLIQNNMTRVQEHYQAAFGPATSGKRVNTISDDPSNISHLFSLRNRVKESEQYQSSVSNARLRLTYTDSRLGEAHDTIQRIIDVGMQGNDASITGSLRTQLAQQITDLKTELLSHANSQFESRYIFAGTATSTKPFAGTPVAFAGNSTIISIQANTSVQIDLNLDGDAIFTGAGGGQDIFSAIDALSTAVGTANSSAISTALDQLKTGLEQVDSARATVGIRQQQIDAIDSALSEDRISILDQLSKIEEVSIDEALTQLTVRETALKLVFSSSSRVLSVLGGLTLQV